MYFCFSEVLNKRVWEAAILNPYGDESDDLVSQGNEDQEVLNDTEDQEVVDDEQCDECLEDAPQDSHSAGLMKDILLAIYKYFGKAFSVSKNRIIHGFENATRSASDIKVAITTDLECTWLKAPTPKGSDAIGTWPKGELKFINKYNWVHEDFSKMIPRQLPIKFVSNEAEKFFARKYIAPPGKISLPSQVFTQDTFTMPKSETHLYEYFGRQGTLECEISHNLLDLTDDMIKALVAKFDTLDLNDQDNDKIKVIKDTFVNLANVNRLAIQSNYRCKTYSIVSCVKAKTALRDSVLNRFKGSNNTKEALRGSSFFTDSLFGPLPSSLTDNLNACSSRSSGVLYTNFTNPKKSVKRKSDTSHLDYASAKRSNYNNVGNSSGRGGFYNSPNYNSNNYNNGNNNSNNNSNNNNSASVSKFATSPHFPNRPHNPQRGRGQKKRGSRS